MRFVNCVISRIDSTREFMLLTGFTNVVNGLLKFIENAVP